MENLYGPRVLSMFLRARLHLFANNMESHLVDRRESGAGARVRLHQWPGPGVHMFRCAVSRTSRHPAMDRFGIDVVRIRARRNWPKWIHIVDWNLRFFRFPTTLLWIFAFLFSRRGRF